MKKLSLIFIILISLITINKIKANVIVTLPNTLNNNYIAEEDLIYNSNIEWDKEGRYIIDYFEKENMNFNSVDVIISSLEDLKKGISFSKNKTYIVDEYVKVNKIIHLNNDEYFIIGAIDPKQYPYPSQSEKHYGYLAYFKHDKLIWDKIFKEGRYGKLVDGVITDLGIAVIGEYDSINHEKNVFIDLMSFNNQVIFSKEIMGSLNDYPKSIYYYNNYLYFTGMSDSKDLDFQANTLEGNDIFYGKLSISNQKVEVVTVGNNDNDTLYNSVFIDGKFYLLACLRGEGFYYNNFNNSKNFKCIIEVDEQFEVHNWIAFADESPLGQEKLRMVDENLVLTNLDSKAKKLYIKLFDFKLKLNKEKTFSFSNYNNIFDYEILTFNNKILINGLVSENTKTNLSIYYLFDSNLQTIFEYREVLNYIPEQIYLESLAGVMRSIYLSSNNELMVSDITNIRLEKNEFATQISKVKDYLVYINNELKPKVKITNNQRNTFGSYIELYKVQVGSIEVVIPIEIYVFPNINIYNDEVYDEGLVIKFNGKGYLNDKEISSNYEILDSGKYVLEVIGTNNEKKVINFTVKKLSKKAQELADIEENVFLKTSNQKDLNSNININYQDFAETELDNKALIIVFSITSLGLILGITLPLNFWRRKYV